MGYKHTASDYMKEYRKEHYRANKEAHYRRNELTDRRIYSYILSLKNETPCNDCGVIYINEPWLMEFDHIEDEKIDSIAVLRMKGSLIKVKKEIDKCQLVCLICHRRRTAARANWGSSVHSLNGKMQFSKN